MLQAPRPARLPRLAIISARACLPRNRDSYGRKHRKLLQPVLRWRHRRIIREVGEDVARVVDVHDAEIGRDPDASAALPCQANVEAMRRGKSLPVTRSGDELRIERVGWKRL